MRRQNYYLISVSTRENLELCKNYGLAGFTSSINGVWAFLEIQKGDFVSFLYSARAHNLYKVVKKEAIENAEELPPWKKITFKQSGRTYYFPFRISLRLVREFNEPLVRPEFAYVAENLLLRGGYRKTHFQADQTTLQYVSQMGNLANNNLEELSLSQYFTLIPKFTREKRFVNIPKIFPFREVI
ncbi:MAG: hypothetical protein J7M03_07355, partial [Candidatus Desulfofervidaceae bacterium]|nr:hypothetical protein [Candidatus Desulfofervidaceae bacterium]